MHDTLFDEARLLALLKARDLQALVGTSAEHVTYLSGFWAMPQWIRKGPQVYAVRSTAHDSSFVVVPNSILDQAADQQLSVGEVHRYGFFAYEGDLGAVSNTEDLNLARYLSGTEHGSAAQALAFGLRRIGVASGRVALDPEGIAPAERERLAALLPGVEWVDADALLRELRKIKTTEEIARLKRGANIAERSIQAALAMAREGCSERDLARAFHAQTVSEDASPVLGCIGFGTRSAHPNVEPSAARRLRPGDNIRFDVGGRYAQYRADIARIACFGPPSPKLEAYYGAVKAGIDRAYEIIRPGLKACDLFEQIVGTVRRSGIAHYRRNHVGHGIGLGGYETPALTPASRDVLEPGMVMCIETPYYEIGAFGVQVEDTVVVTADGVQSLMTTDRRLLYL
jgi:Xaa-Pro dipeptidase